LFFNNDKKSPEGEHNASKLVLLFVIHIPQTVINKRKNYNQQEAFDTTAATQPHMSHCPGTAVIEVNLQDSGAQRLWRR